MNRLRSRISSDSPTFHAMFNRVLGAFGAAFLALAIAGPLAAQATELGRQTLGRPFWFVFLAYAIVVALIGGWVISIARRLRRIEDRLPARDG